MRYPGALAPPILSLVLTTTTPPRESSSTLSDDEQGLWRAWLTTSRAVLSLVDNDLKSTCAISLGDFELLSRLAEAPQYRMRMSDLAEALVISRSRLTHQVDRLTRLGLVDREFCDDDRRGVHACVTPRGIQRLGEAIPVHAESLQRHFLERLNTRDTQALARVCARFASSS